MDQTAQMLEAWRLYTGLYQAYFQRGVSQALDGQDKENAEKVGDEAHYFAIGADALRNVIAALSSSGLPPPKGILDFPSGSGRVTRHLRAFFPDARLYACDLYESHIRFCAENLDAIPILSNEQIEEIRFPEQFDLIFCGSLLTHLPEVQCRQAISLIARSLTETGIAIVTLHGRYSPFVQRNKFQYLRDDLFQLALADVRSSGFGYVDYDADFKAKFSKQEAYGVTLVRPSWVLKQIEEIEGVRVFGYRERAWDDHQDVIIFGRPGIYQPDG